MKTIETKCNIDLGSIQYWLTDNNYHSVRIFSPAPGIVQWSEPDDYGWLERFLVQAFNDRFEFVGGKLEVVCEHGFSGDCMTCDPEPYAPWRDPRCDGYVDDLE